MHHKLNTYLADLGLLNVKFHNMHWNLTGPQFVQLHEYTEKAYDQFFEYFDEIAELLKMRDVFPLASLKDYLAVSKLAELPNQPITVPEVLDVLKETYTYLLDLVTVIRNEADAANDFVVVAKLEDHAAFYQKQLWFIRSIQA